MDAGLRTFVDSFGVENGRRLERANSIGILEESPIIPTKHGRGNAYVMVETIGGFPDAATVKENIIEIVEENYRTPGSITTGIRSAIKAANAYLFEENLNAPKDNRGIAGITCVVLKDRDAFVGQCGPAVLYHVGQGQFKRLPPESTWLSSATLPEVDIGKQPPLGLRREIEPELTHLRLREGDVLMLASTSLAKLVSDEQVATAALHSGAAMIRDNLEGLAVGKDFSALVIQVLAEEAAALAEGVEVSAPRRAQPGLLARISSALQRRPYTQSETEGERIETVPSAEEERGVGMPLPSLDLGEGLRSIGQAVSRVWKTLVTLLHRVLPEAESTRKSRESRSRAGYSIPQQRGWDGQAATPRKRTAGQEIGFDRRWLWAAAAIPIIVLLLVVLTHLQNQRARQAEFKRLMASVEETRTAAEAIPAIAEQRAKLQEMLSLIDQALAIKPGDPDLSKERESTQAWLDRATRVSRIFYFGPLQEFVGTETAQVDLHRVVVQDINVFVLDLGTDRVFKFLLNEAKDVLKPLEGDQVLLRKGDQRGDFVVDELLDIAWVEAGAFRGSSNLLTLDQKGHVLEYDPMLGLGQLPSADSSTWAGPVAATGYVGRLYLLDPKGNQVLRFVLTNSGFEGTPASYFPSEARVDLSKAIDLAIDGDVYILSSDGTISKYRDGKAVPFTLNNLDMPLQAPRSILVTGSMDESGYVYVADSGNQRVVQFSKAGEFIRQFRPGDAKYMNDLRSIFIEEEAKRLFLLNGSGLYMAYLPE